MPLAVPAAVAQSRASTPLTDDEGASLERSLQRLRLELRAFMGALPVEAQTASGMARLLGIERTTCQRVVASVTPAYPGVELGAQLPGTKGLEMLADAGAGHGPDDELLRSLKQAIRAHDAVVRTIAGSQSRLVRRLQQKDAGGPPATPEAAGDDLAARRQLFQAATALTGRWSEVWLATHVYTPIAGKADLLRQTRAHGLVGHRARADAVPLTFHIFGDELAAEGDAESGAFEAGVYRPIGLGGAPARRDAVLSAFSTEPVPVVRAKSPGEAVVQTIDASPDGRGGSDTSIDLLFGLDGGIPHPSSREQRLEEIWAMVNFPVRRMVFDVLLHRDLARACIPALDTHLWRPDFARETGERWQTRFGASPRLEVLGSGLGQFASPAYGRYAELMGELFGVIGADPADYVGYRCDVEFPMWRTGYRMSLDFGEPN